MESNQKELPIEGTKEDLQIDVQAESIEIKISEVLPDGTRRKVTFTAKDGVRIIRSKSKSRTQIPWWVFVFGLILIAIGIGLVASGPQDVWEWLQDLILGMTNND